MPRISLVSALLAVLIVTTPYAHGDDKVYVAEIQGHRSMIASRPSKLSPVLLAVRDAGGVLKGSDDNGRPILSVPPPNIHALTVSASVRAVLQVARGNWHPVQQLKIS